MISLFEKRTKCRRHWNILFVGMVAALALVISGCVMRPIAAGLPQNEDAIAHNIKGVRYLQTGSYKLAISELEKAAQIERTSATVHLNLGIAYYFYGQYEQAITSLQESSMINPNHFRTKFGLGNALYAARRFKEASAEYEKYDGIEICYFRPLYLPSFLKILSLMRAGEIEKTQMMLAALGYYWQYSALDTFIGYLLGEMSEEELLEKIRGAGGPRLSAYLFIGVNNIVKNNFDVAEIYLQKIIDVGHPTSSLYIWAKVNLEHIHGMIEKTGTASKTSTTMKGVYSGPLLPPDKIAFIEESGMHKIGAIDGKRRRWVVNERISLAPGEHTLAFGTRVYCDSYKISILKDIKIISFKAEADHYYLLYRKGEDFWIEDRATREVVAGKKPY